MPLTSRKERKPVAVELWAIAAGAATAFADVLHDAGERVFELATQPRALAAKQLDGGAKAADQIEGEIESKKRHERSPVVVSQPQAEAP
jgi:hypothetical protein